MSPSRWRDDYDCARPALVPFLAMLALGAVAAAVVLFWVGYPLWRLL